MSADAALHPDFSLPTTPPGYVADGKSFLAWVGGKSLLAQRVIAHMPAHHCYCEVFAGAAWVLFRKTESRVEVINDLNGELVNLYRCVQNHLEELVRHFKWALVSREEFTRLRETPPESLTDIQRASRFLYLLKAAYGAKVVNPSFNAIPALPSRLNLLRIEEELSAAHLRLSRVTIERRPYANLLERFDRDNTFFYLDPPYWGSEHYYGKGLFTREDFTTLRDQLAGIKGKWLMSINDTPEVRELFRAYHIVTAATRWSLGAKNAGVKKVEELLICNYQPPKVPPK